MKFRQTRISEKNEDFETLDDLIYSYNSFKEFTDKIKWFFSKNKPYVEYNPYSNQLEKPAESENISLEEKHRRMFASSEKTILELEEQIKEEKKSLTNAYKQFMVDANRRYEGDKIGLETFSELITRTASQLSNVDLDKKAVDEFTKTLTHYKGLHGFSIYTACFLSAIYQASKEDSFELDLQELNKEGILLDHVGGGLKNKKLRVIGNVGESFGRLSELAVLTLQGHAGNYLGSHIDHTQITVEGNVKDYLALYSKDSSVTVKGKAGDHVAWGAANTSLIINGGYYGLNKEFIGRKTKIFKGCKQLYPSFLGRFMGS